MAVTNSIPPKVGVHPDTRAFLNTIFGNKPAGQNMLIWEVTARGQKISRWCRTIDEACHVVAECESTSAVYVEVAFTAKSSPAYERAKESETTGITCLWIDLDYGTPEEGAHKKGNLPPTLEAAEQFLDELPIQPSVLVNSGYGLHAYYLLDSPWVWADEADRRAAATVLKTWEEVVRAQAAKHGYEVDAVADLARVLRLPGTRNNKLPKNPVLARIMRNEPDRRYARTDFGWDRMAPYLMGPVVSNGNGHGAQKNGAALVNVTVLPPRPRFEDRAKWDDAQAFMRGVVLNADADVPASKLDALRALDKRAALTLDRKRRDFPKHDYSPSAYDMSLATFAVQLGWSAQEIVDLLISQRRKWGDDLKLDNPEYYGLTLLNAKIDIEKQAAMTTLNRSKALAQAHVHAATDENAPPDPDSERSEPATVSKTDLLASVSRLLEIKIIEVQRLLSEPKGYVLVTEKGNVVIDHIRDLTTQRLLREAIADVTGHWFPKMDGGTWDEVIVPTLLAVRVDLDVSSEATQTGRMEHWLEDYLDSNPPSDVTEQTILNKQPFVEDEDTYVFAGSLRSYLWARNERQEHNKLCNLLRQIGAEPVKKHVIVNGKQAMRHVWRLPPPTDGSV